MAKKIIVIGAGVGGLSAACRLQNRGFDVTLYEKTAQPGGKMRRISRDGFHFDVGPTLVMMPEIYEDVFRVCGKDPADYIELHRLNPMMEVYFKDHPAYRHYKVGNDLVELTQLVESKGPENALGFFEYLAAIYKRYQVALDHFITRPFRNKRDFYNIPTLINALKLKTFDSAEKMMASFMPDEDLQRMLSFQTLYIGVSPKNGPSLYNIIPMIELLYGVWFLKGGMHSMADAMAKLFQDLGGTLRYESEVEQILVENKVAKGVRVNGENVYADHVVCNADFPYAVTELLQDPEAQKPYTPEKIQDMDYSCSCLVFYWGMDKYYQDLHMHNFVISTDLDDNLRSIFDGRRIKDPSIYLSIPSQNDPTMAPEGKSSFYCLIPVPELKTGKDLWDEETIDYYRQSALNTLEGLPGLEHIRDEILFEEKFTPVDFKEHFNAMYGATFGLQPTLRQSNHWRPQAKAKNCEHLYFCGSSCHPGAGVPIVMESGNIAYKELMKDEGVDLYD